MDEPTAEEIAAIDGWLPPPPPVEGRLYKLGPNVKPAWLAGRRAFFHVERIRTSCGNVVEQPVVRVLARGRVLSEEVESFQGVEIRRPWVR